MKFLAKGARLGVQPFANKQEKPVIQCTTYTNYQLLSTYMFQLQFEQQEKIILEEQIFKDSFGLYTQAKAHEVP